MQSTLRSTLTTTKMKMKGQPAGWTETGQKVGIVQIAGLVARRILLESAVDDELAIGQQFGIIRFGSRVDLWLPAETPVLVLAGQRTVAGETVLADLSGKLAEPKTARQR